MANASAEKGMPKGFRTRTIKTQEDVDRVIRFNEIVWGEEENEEYGKIVGEMVRGLITQHPHTSFDDFFFVENEKSGELVSFLCLVPLKWKYGDVNLKVATVECVGTLKPYRRRGFIKALMEKYEERLREGEYDLSVVWGIPYFYRQFGYEYALSYREECILRFDQISDQKRANITIHPMTIQDIPSAPRLLDQSLKKFFVHTIRDESIWLYQERRKMSTEYLIESFVVESNGAVSGYFRSIREGHQSVTQSLSILEASDLTYDCVLEVLRYAKSIAESRDKTPVIRVFLPVNSPFVEAAKYLGGQISTPIRYLIKFPDVVQFLTKMKPVLEKRIKESIFQGLTMTLTINLFKLIIRLCFVDGVLRNVEHYDSSGDVDEFTAKINPFAFCKLLIGDSNIEEIAAQYPDVIAYGKIRHILAILFPKTMSYIISGY